MADKIRVGCPTCGKRFVVPVSTAGNRVRCACGAVMVVPKTAQKADETLLLDVEPGAEGEGESEVAEGDGSGEEGASTWYYARNGEKSGPYRESELASLCRDGKVSGEDYVWSQGMAEWLKASEVKAFSSALAGRGAKAKAAGAEEDEGAASSNRMAGIGALAAIGLGVVVALLGALLSADDSFVRRLGALGPGVTVAGLGVVSLLVLEVRKDLRRVAGQLEEMRRDKGEGK